jgi:hypothetical protein
LLLRVCVCLLCHGVQLPAGYYDYALDLILDEDAGADEHLSEEQHELVECAAEQLYGLIHARFILSVRGLAAMLDKYKAVAFGRCPRVLCGGQPCLPVGQHDLQGQGTVKIFCPKCGDIYFPRSKYQMHIDGAFFGTTFPHLFLMTYESLRVPPSTAVYTPRVFGFRVAPEVLRSGGSGNGGGAGAGAVGTGGQQSQPKDGLGGGNTQLTMGDGNGVLGGAGGAGAREGLPSRREFVQPDAGAGHSSGGR